MTTPFTIHRLCEKPEWAAQCQAWDEAEWPRTPEIAEFFSDHYQEACKNFGSTLPQTFIALTRERERPIGMLSLIAEDHPDFLHLRPWIASGFILPDYRHSRAFYLLNQATIHFAQITLKEKYLYVYTHLQAIRKGWEFLQTINDPFDEDEKVGLYRYDVTQSIDSTKTE